MDTPTLLLLYNSIKSDFKSLIFHPRKVFCLGLLTGFSIMEGTIKFFETINPHNLPLDIISPSELESESTKYIIKIQMDNIYIKVRHLKSFTTYLA